MKPWSAGGWNVENVKPWPAGGWSVENMKPWPAGGWSVENVKPRFSLLEIEELDKTNRIVY